jgi:hypothetical protein
MSKRFAFKKNPYPNEHSARLKRPSGYKRFRRQNDRFGTGIHAIWGITSDGYAELQAIRFDLSQFTLVQAKTWIKQSGYRVLKFEPAKFKKNPVSYLDMWNDIATSSKAELIRVIKELKGEGLPDKDIIKSMTGAGIDKRFAEWIMTSFVWR